MPHLWNNVLACFRRFACRLRGGEEALNTLRLRLLLASHLRLRFLHVEAVFVDRLAIGTPSFVRIDVFGVRVAHVAAVLYITAAAAAVCMRGVFVVISYAHRLPSTIQSSLMRLRTISEYFSSVTTS